MQSMTRGRPLSLLVAFALPLFAGNLFQQLYNLVDVFIVGRCVGVSALAAVGSTTSMVFLVYGFIAGITSGFGVLAAQHFGADDLEKVRESFAVSIFLSVILTAVFTVACTLLARPVLSLMNTPAEILGDAALYAQILFLGLATTLGTQLFASILRAVGDSKTPLYFQFFSCLLNIALDLLFVLAFGWGVPGVALATVIAQLCSVLLCVRHIHKNYPALHLSKRHWKIDMRRIRVFLALGLPMGFQRIIVEIGNLIMQTALNSLGAGAIAAVTTALKIRAFGMMPIFSLGTAVSTFTAQNFGAKNLPRIREGLRSALLLTACIWAAAALLFALAGDRLAGFFLGNEPEIIALAHRHLTVNGLALVLCGLLILLRNALLGLGKSFASLLSGFAELGASMLAAWVLVPLFGFWGCALAHPVAWLLSSIPLAFIYMHTLQRLRRSPLYAPK